MDIAEPVQEKLSASHVGQIVSGGAQVIKDASKRFSQLQDKIQDEILGDTLSSQMKLLASLEAQKQKLSDRVSNSEAQYDALHSQKQELQTNLDEKLAITRDFEKQLKDLDSVDTAQNQKLVSQLATLVEANEAARKKETTFKDDCRSRAEKIKQEIK